MGANVNPTQELQAILKNGGGLKLAYRLMKSSLYEHACILTVVEQACWDYYTNELETCKSPADNLKRSWNWQTIKQPTRGRQSMEDNQFG